MAKNKAMQARRRAQRWGHRSESIAAAFLLLNGYKIKKTRYKTKAGEIDIIAQRGNLIAFVEVKARKTAREAVDAVSAANKRRVESAADIWISRQNDVSRFSFRFDIIAIRPWRWPVHLKDAF